MLRFCLLLAGTLAALCMFQTDTASAQQVQVTTPFMSINDSFYENFGTGWGMNGKNWYFNTGPANSTPPPFGGYDPAADARFGFGFRKGGFGLDFNWLAGQGSNRSMVMEAPTIVIPNGGSGSLFSGSVTPFVTGVVPVVGNAPLMPMMPAPSSVSPLEERLERLRQQEALAQAQPPAEDDPLPAAPIRPQPVAAAGAGDDQPLVLKGDRAAELAGAASGSVSAAAAMSTANHGDISVAEIRRRQAAEDAARQEEILVRIEKARGYEEVGKPGLAKIYYQQAATRAEGELKQQLLEKIRSLGE